MDVPDFRTEISLIQLLGQFKVKVRSFVSKQNRLKRICCYRFYNKCSFIRMFPSFCPVLEIRMLQRGFTVE